MKKTRSKKSRDTVPLKNRVIIEPFVEKAFWDETRVSTEFRRHGIPRNFLTSEVISPELSRKSLPYSAECQNVTSVDTKLQRFLNLRYWSTGGGT
jgi:hypothetical protein